MQPTESMTSLKVFISYAHEDLELHKKLLKHLVSLERSGEITIWQDQEIPAGANWEDQIDMHLNQAGLILLLVSADFIASKYCWSKEVQVALRRHEEGKVRVVPVVLRPVSWQGTPLGQLQALPADAKPVTEWKSQDAALDNVAQGIQRAVEDLQKKRRKLSDYGEKGNAPPAVRPPLIRPPVTLSPRGPSLGTGAKVPTHGGSIEKPARLGLLVPVLPTWAKITAIVVLCALIVGSIGIAWPVDGKGLSLDKYCESLHYEGLEKGQTAYEWKCTKPKTEQAKWTDICNWTYSRKDLEARDEGAWRCYVKNTNNGVGGMGGLLEYCKTKGHSDTKCIKTSSELKIDITQACIWQWQRGDVWAHTDDPNDPNSWRCQVRLFVFLFYKPVFS